MNSARVPLALRRLKNWPSSIMTQHREKPSTGSIRRLVRHSMEAKFVMTAAGSVTHSTTWVRTL